MGIAERFSLAGKRAVVTGASKGIGAVISAVLAEAGADIAVTGSDRAGLDDTAAQVRAHGRRCLTIEADLATVEGANHVAAAALGSSARSTSSSTAPASRIRPRCLLRPSQTGTK